MSRTVAGPAAHAATVALLAIAASPAQGQEPEATALDVRLACLTGAYQLADGSRIVITPSDEGTLRYRLLDGRSGRLYPDGGNQFHSGEGWAAPSPIVARARFGSCSAGRMEFEIEGGQPTQGQRIANRVTPARFTSRGVELYGQLHSPPASAAHALVILQYGSGRESAVSYNYLQHLLPLYGVAVFVFDKRGTGRSGGSYSADFDVLASDLVAAARTARSLPRVGGIPVGLMGESQGGWVAPLAATRTRVDFVVVSFGLAISPLEEDREEVLEGLRHAGYGADTVARGLQVVDVADRIMLSRFTDGVQELERLRAAYHEEAWYAHLGGDFTGVLANAAPDRFTQLRALFDFPYDLEYEPVPTLRRVTVPMLWVLAGKDTEAPSASTLSILRDLQAGGAPIDIATFPRADHGIIEVEDGAQGLQLLGRQSEGYYDMLGDWMLTRSFRRQYGSAIQASRRSLRPSRPAR